VPTTSGRSRGRQGVRSGAAGPAGEHVPKIMLALVATTVVVVFTLVMTKAGRDIDAATQRFMLYYAGVFALIGLTASVGAGLMATDRIFMTPGHRVMAQAVHRAVSFAALAFLVIHIVTEILAQRVHVIDAFIPFLSPYRTFYIGLGTIASDLILLVVATSILRKRFTAHGKAWRWRAVHYASYVAFVLGVLHGLLGGREAKPYVDWSYGFAIAATALALAVRFLAVSLRPKGSLSAPAGAHHASGGAGLQALRAAALGLAQARLGGTVRVPPGALGSPGAAIGVPGTQSWALPPAARDGYAISGPLPALEAPPAYPAYAGSPFTPLGAPAYTNGIAPGIGIHPYAAVDQPGSARAEPGAPAGPVRQPRYEPGYDGPPRFEGAPRTHVPQDDVSSYPYGPRSRPADRNTGPMPRAATGPMPMPRAGTGPMPRAGTGPMPRAGTGPMPRPATGPGAQGGTGPMPRADVGPVPRVDTGPRPRADSGPGLRTGRTPRPDVPPVPPTGPLPRTARRPRGAGPADPRDRDLPGAAGGDEWR
jgi:DMSO/TMAO reductase YedYZ heme-binding membrane subunit